MGPIVWQYLDTGAERQVGYTYLSAASYSLEDFLCLRYVVNIEYTTFRRLAKVC